MQRRARPPFKAAFLALLSLVAAAGPSSTSPTTTGSSATVAAQQYMELFCSGRIGEAFDRYWSLDRTLRLAFGDDLRDVSDREIADTAKVIRDGIVRSLEQPHMIEAFADAECSAFAEELRQDGRTAVTFHTTFAGRAAMNVLIMEKNDGRWRIVDQGKSADGRQHGMTREKLRLPYEQSGKRKPPLQFARETFAALEQVRDAKSKAATTTRSSE